MSVEAVVGAAARIPPWREPREISWALAALRLSAALHLREEALRLEDQAEAAWAAARALAEEVAWAG